MSTIILTIVCAFLGSSALFGFITFMIKRSDDKKGELKEIKESVQTTNDRLDDLDGKLLKAERDSVRTQLLILMAYYKDDVNEIMKCAEHYFKTLVGDWYLTSLFKLYLKEKDIPEPEWLMQSEEDQ